MAANAVEPSRVRVWWSGRTGAPFLRELSIAAVLLLLYRTARGLTRSDLVDAFRHAQLVMRAEHWFGVSIEDEVQRWILNHAAAVKGLNYYYVWMHFPTTVGFLLWTYWRFPGAYRRVRNEMTVLTFVALVVHIAFPLAPPRMLPGFVDTMLRYGPSIYPASALEGAANQIAAMPSLHFGWALVAALWLSRLHRHPIRWAGFLHPALMLLAIVATGNHWLVDAIGAATIVAAARMFRLLLTRRHTSVA